MNSVLWAVIKREYLQRVKTKAFVISTVAGPLILIAMMVLPALIARSGEERDRTLAVVDHTGVLYEGVAPRLEEAGYAVEEAGTDEAELDRLAAVVGDGTLGGYLVLDEATLQRGEVRMLVRSSPSAVRLLSVRQAIVQTALEARLGGDSEDVRALLAGGALEVDVVSGSGAGFRDPRFLSAYIGAMLLYMVLLLYAVAVMRSVLEEKTSRIVEVIISSMRPFHLMLGKIIGVGAVGLTQFGIWVLSAALIFSTGIPALMAARPDFLDMDTISRFVPGVGFAALFFTYFLGGYFIYSGLYAAVGAMCNTDEEAQQAQFPVIMLLIVPVLFLTPVIRDPGTTSATVLSLIPFFSPILMFARASVGGAAGWEIALSIAGMMLAIIAVAWIAGRIYRVGILMAGKRPTLPELWRWVRQS